MASTAPLSPGLVGHSGAGYQKQARVTTQTRVLHVCLCRRTTKGRHFDVLVAQRRERVRIRSGKRIRWGGRPLPAAA